LEYKIKTGEFFLLKINLTEYINELETPDKISKVIFKNYSDIFNKKLVTEKQVI
jgi:hypothetical protein